VEAIEFNAPGTFHKAYEEGGEKYLIIRATDSGPDKQGGTDPVTGERWLAERMTPRFIKAMRDQARAGTIELADGHFGGLPLGKSTGVAEGAEYPEVDENGYETFWPVFKINEHPVAEWLWSSVNDGTCDRTASIGGKISSVYKQRDPEVGGLVKFIDFGVVDHVATCRPGTEAHPRTSFAGALVKALDATGFEWPEVGGDGRGGGDEDSMVKAELYVEGERHEVYIDARDIGEAEATAAPYRATSFSEALAVANAAVEKPKYDKIFDQVLRYIRDAPEDELDGDRETLAQTALREYFEAMKDALSKTRSSEDLGNIIGGKAAAQEDVDMQYTDEQLRAAREVIVAAGTAEAEVTAMEETALMEKVLTTPDLFQKWVASLGEMDASSARPIVAQITEDQNAANNYLLAKIGEVVGGALAEPLKGLTEVVASLQKDIAATADAPAGDKPAGDKPAADGADGADGRASEDLAFCRRKWGRASEPGGRQGRGRRHQGRGGPQGRLRGVSGRGTIAQTQTERDQIGDGPEMQ